MSRLFCDLVIALLSPAVQHQKILHLEHFCFFQNDHVWFGTKLELLKTFSSKTQQQQWQRDSSSEFLHNYIILYYSPLFFCISYLKWVPWVVSIGLCMGWRKFHPNFYFLTHQPNEPSGNNAYKAIPLFNYLYAYLIKILQHTFCQYILTNFRRNLVRPRAS